MAGKKFNVAVVGATGAVGNQMIICLEEVDFSSQCENARPFLYASILRAGTKGAP